MLGSVDNKLIVGAPAANAKRGRLLAWRPTTPLVLRLAMLLACVPLVLVCLAIRVAIERNDTAIDTVGEDATRGITVAQEIKTNLAELDQLVAMSLLPDSTGNVDASYAAKRRDVMDSLTRASAETSSSAAYRDALVNLDYAFGHYHSLVTDSLAAQAAGDRAGAATQYQKAHEVMATTLLPEADFVDKANTYLLNVTFDRHTDEATDSRTTVLVAGFVAAAVLVLAQVLLVARFRRTVNPALLVATLLIVALGVTVIHDLDLSADKLQSATDESFEAVHALARARAVAVTARQAEAQWLLDQSPANREAIEDALNRLYRLQEGDVGTDPIPGELPDDAGGFLAAAVFAGGNNSAAAGYGTLDPFAAFVRDDRSLRRRAPDQQAESELAQFRAGPTYDTLVKAIDQAQATEQAAFDRSTRDARNATDRERNLTVAVTAAVVLLALGGLYARLREYRR
jgi:hypothetical protein